jgi:catechol 2,3-dioxygenase-like lactoylglutathione lyase family enzyme
MIRRMNHVGISVSSLERSIEFYRTGLDMEVLVQGAFAGHEYETVLGLKGATGRVALLKAADMQLELFEFSHPAPKAGDPQRPVCDHGITHFCVEVADIAGEYERLKAAGASFHCPPLNFFGAATATYGRDPDGNVFELLQLNGAGGKSQDVPVP